MITRSVFFCLYLILATSSIFAADFGESVAKVWDKAKETFCHRVDGVIADIEACKQYTHKGGEKYFEELYEMARERLYAAVEQAKAAADYFISNSQGFADGAQQAAYEMYEGAKKGLQLASEQTYKAASKMVHSGQNYVEQAQRQSSNMYSEAMAMLNSAAEEARVIAQEVFEGKEHEPKEPFDNHDQVQDAYERVADAAARGIEKAFEKVAELGVYYETYVVQRRAIAKTKLFAVVAAQEVVTEGLMTASTAYDRVSRNKTFRENGNFGLNCALSRGPFFGIHTQSSNI